MRMVISLLLVGLLGACSTAYNACPPVVTYTQDQRNILADELDDMIRNNSFPQTREMIDDYVTLYAAVKACQA
jgi:lipopolysaccharide export LptBFGC system permease protein LptF